MESTTFTRPERGAQLELRVESLAYGGNGIARLEAPADGRGGYVVFVSGAIPGDVVRAVVTKRKRGYAEARTLEVLEPSPERIAPLADHPGAPWQVLPYERQLAVKREQVHDALTRIGKLDGFALDDIVPAVEQWRYRNKLEYSFGTADDGTLVCGFHAPGSWHEIVSVADCLLASEASNRARDQVLAWCRSNGLQAMDRRTHTGLLRNLVVREGRRTGALQVRIVTGPGDLDTSSLAAAVECEGLMWTRTDALAESTVGGDTSLIAGAPALQEEIGGLQFAISPLAFFQTNTEMAERLYASPATSPTSRAGSASSTCTAGSARSASRSRRVPARSGGLRSSSPRSPTRSRTPSATRSATRSSSPATSGSRCASSSTRRAGPTSA